MSHFQTIIPRLIEDLQQPNSNLHVPALRQILNIVLDQTGSKELILQHQFIQVLNKFIVFVNESKEYALSAMILNAISINNETVDKIVLAGAATEPLIRMIHSQDEQISKAGSKSLVELIEENSEIRKSLLTTGLLQIVQHAFPCKNIDRPKQPSSLSSESLQKDTILPDHIRNNLLDLLLKLAGSAEDLQPLSILIPIIERIKTDGEPEFKNKAKRILTMIAGEEISSLSDTKEKDEKIYQLEQENKKLKDTISNEKKEKEMYIQRAKDSNNQIMKQQEDKKGKETSEEIQILKESNKCKNKKCAELSLENTKLKNEIDNIKLYYPQ
ncbi:MAG: hypothetical protein EZS28_039614, partial [Streblomastix strix]